MSAKIEVKNLTISFRTNNGAVRAVRNISFTINEGETLAIAGESGSGKSVTTKAIMGISAPNAVVENGEIIYDGRDLLKIDEEDFHTLRGHKLSMVFQDPLSALNPVMRIGKQLTEAMILNNRERRRDGKKNFNRVENTVLSNLPAEKKGAVKEQFARFKAALKSETAAKIQYDDAKTACHEMQQFIQDMNNDLLKGVGHKQLKESAGRLTDSIKNAVSYLGADEAKGAISQIESVINSGKKTEAKAIAEQLKSTLDGLSQKADRMVQEERRFYDTVKEEYDALKASIVEAMMQSANTAHAGKQKAITVLQEGRALFAAEKLSSASACRDAAKKMSEAVGASIDRLSLVKDNASYVFSSSMAANIDRYFTGVKKNPSEHARFVRETEKHDARVAAGKETPEVVPEFLVDLDNTRLNIVRSIDDVISNYQNAELHTDKAYYEARADEMINYLRGCYYDSLYKLPMWVAKNRAISLMKEVGIPEPYKRYHQYPFEFSGGMRQRIVIAIALSANPDLLICDEPTTALDVTIQAQILELINRLKKERNLTVIFITHDLGVVANMADKIAIMYAGKIVEYGTANDVFYDPRHPYTWALLSSMPDLETKEKLEAIPGTPPNMIFPPKGDAFADRNKYALKIDFEQQPPEVKVNETHWAATWLLHPSAPQVEPPMIVTERIKRMKSKMADKREGGAEA